MQHLFIYSCQLKICSQAEIRLRQLLTCRFRAHSEFSAVSNKNPRLLSLLNANDLNLNSLNAADLDLTDSLFYWIISLWSKLLLFEYIVSIFCYSWLIFLWKKSFEIAQSKREKHKCCWSYYSSHSEKQNILRNTKRLQKKNYESIYCKQWIQTLKSFPELNHCAVCLL